MPALSHQPGLAAAVAALTGMALANDRLTEVINASQAELRDSRTRIQSAADTERRRIELNIHDGAQQRIVGLRIKLELARETLAEHGSEDAHLLDGLSDETIEILDELRSLARGVYPPVLTQMGPEEALRAAGAPLSDRRDAPFGSPPPLLAGRRGSRLLLLPGSDAELGQARCCEHPRLRHALARPVVLRGSRRRSRIRPGAMKSTGTGLIHLRDRLAALDGDLQIISAPGRGTTGAGNDSGRAALRAGRTASRCPEGRPGTSVPPSRAC